MNKLNENTPPVRAVRAEGGIRGGSRRAGRLLAALTVSMTLAQGVEAAEYDVTHNFRLRPGGNIVPVVTSSFYAHSFIRERLADCEDFAVVPAVGVQGAAFNPYGRDILRDRRGRVRNRGLDGRWRDVANGFNLVPAAGTSDYYRAFTRGCRSIADAKCQIDVNPFVAGGRVTGTIRAWGEAKAALRPPRRSQAYAFSMAMVEAQGGRLLRNGNIRWRKVVRDLVAGRAQQRRQVDPIDYTVTDLVTGEVFTGTFYSVLIEINKAGGGGFTWENDTVKLSSQNASFKVEFPSPFTSLQGLLELEVKAGKVTKSIATGHYAGVLPPVGTVGPIEFPLSQEVDFDYDLGDHDGRDLDVNLEFSGAGEAVEERAADPELTVTTGRDATSPTVTLTWPPQNVPVVVQQTTNLANPNAWTPMTMVPEVVDGMHCVRLPVQPGRDAFFRLETQEDFVTDEDAPKFLVEAVCGEPMVLINYNEPVVPEAAQDPFLYLVVDQFGQPNPVLDAQMLSPESVMLFLQQPIQPGVEYQAVVLGGISDLAGNEMAPDYAVPIDCAGGPGLPGGPDLPPGR